MAFWRIAMKQEVFGGSFAWAAGIENTFIPQDRPGCRALDEYELVQHYERWREDLQLASSLGIKYLRWGVPWYRVEREPGVFDWSWVDKVMQYMVGELGITPIVDLVHYGTPLWLTFADATYPDRVRRFANAFSKRYRDQVRYYTPLNEPTITAHMAGRCGAWPPCLTGEEGYVKVLLAVTHGMQLTARAILRNRPDAVFVTADAMACPRPLSPEAEVEADIILSRDTLAWDLVRGAVNAKHPLYRFLRDHGATVQTLAAMRRRRVEQHVLGFAIYPWSVFDLYTKDGRVESRPSAFTPELFAANLRRIYSRVQQPLFISETSCPGDEKTRAEWMQATAKVIREAQADGIPVVGYCWFPMISMIAWDYQGTDKHPFEHLLHMGLWDLTPNGTDLERRPTSLVAEYQALVAS